MLRIILTLIALVFVNTSLAHDFAARIDNAEWLLEPTPLQCKLAQPVPQYGMAVFEVNAGEEMRFYLESDRPITNKGSAALKITSPFWRPGIQDKKVGEIKTQLGKRPVVVSRELADRMLDELMAGMIPTLEIKGWTKDHSLEIGISSVNFQDAYNGLLSCLSGLYPANFQQLENSFLLFDTNKYGLKSAARERLDLIAGYVQLDPDVGRIYVYGHTDNVGRRGHNWELSRLRAKEVKEYLVKQGVDPSMIVTNYFGETRPRVKNTTPSNRLKNRRVYVRLKKTT